MKSISEIVDFIFNKTAGPGDTRTEAERYNDHLRKVVTVEEDIVKNKIRIETLRKIDTATVQKALDGAENLDEYLISCIEVKIAEKIPALAKNVVDNAMYNLSGTAYLKTPIKLFIINKIRKIFGAKELSQL